MHNAANMVGWLGVILNAGAQLLLAPIIKARLGAAGLGAWHLIFQTFAYLQLIDFGWSNGIVREIAACPSQQQGSAGQNLMRTFQRVLSVLGLAFSVIGVGAAWLLPHVVNIPVLFRWDFVVAIGLLAAWGMPRYHFALPLLALRARNRIVAFNVLEIVQGAGRPILGALMALAHMGLVGIAAGYAVAEAAARLIARRICPLDTKPGQFDRHLLCRTIRFGGATGVISLSTLVTFYSSSFIIGWKLDVVQVAVFQSTIALPLLLTRLAIIPFTNRLPSLISGFQQNSAESLMSAAVRTHKLVIGISGCLLTVACIFNKFFVTIWVGGELFAGTGFSLVFAAFLLMNIARHNGFMVWQARGRLRGMVLAHLFEIPVIIILSIALIDHFGLNGIAWAFFLASIPSAIVSQLSFYLLGGSEVVRN